MLAGEGALDSLHLSAQLLQCTLVAGDVHVVSLLQQLDEVLHHPLVEVLT